MDPSVAGRQHVVNDGPPVRTPAGDALTDLVMQVVRLIRDFTPAGEALARPAAHTGARRLARAGRGVQRVAAVLVRDGLGVSEPNPAHRRAKLLRLTPEGRSALRTV